MNNQSDKETIRSIQRVKQYSDDVLFEPDRSLDRHNDNTKNLRCAH